MATQPVTRLTEEEYLSRERAAESRSEYVDGEVYAMSGGRPRHAELAVQTGLEFKLPLRGRSCHVFSSDMRVRTARTGAQLYPDLSIVCGNLRFYKDSVDVLENPSVIVEILSPSTADYDHGKKFGLYREFPSLMDYLLLHTSEPCVECYSRQPDGSWVLREHRGLDERVSVPSLAIELSLASLYDGIFDLPA